MVRDRGKKDNDKDSSGNGKYYVTAGLLALGLITLILIAYAPLSPWYLWWEDDEEVPITPTTRTVSTVAVWSNVDGELVSSFVEWDVWIPKTGADFSEGYEDITALATNFEREITGKDADDISIDLRDHEWVWFEATGNTVFDNTFYLRRGEANFDYDFLVHHRSSDVNFNILNSSMASITIPGHSTNFNGTGILKAPGYTTTDCHYGDIGWELTATEFAELTTKEKKEIWDENRWRDQWPVYIPTDDICNEFDRDFEKITNTPALKWTFNDTISVIDGAVTQINYTIGKGYPIEILISGTFLYMVWYEGFDFYPDPYTFEFEMWFGLNISVTTVESGRADIPGSLSTLSWAETYSTIGT